MVNEMPTWSIRSIVISVRDLDRSSAFYQEVMSAPEVLREDQMAVISGDSTAAVYLREAPRTAAHPGQALGFRAVAFDVRSVDELNRVERFLRDSDAFRGRQVIDEAMGVEIVDGHDPDRLPLVFVAQGANVPLHDFRRALARLYSIDV